LGQVDLSGRATQYAFVVRAKFLEVERFHPIAEIVKSVLSWLLIDWIVTGVPRAEHNMHAVFV
jgi:hypothetical protein